MSEKKLEETKESSEDSKEFPSKLFVILSFIFLFITPIFALSLYIAEYIDFMMG